MGRRVISVYLRWWPVEVRLRQMAREKKSPNGPFVVVDYSRQSQTIVAACQRAAGEGIGPGMSLAHARTICSETLNTAPANHNNDARKLDQLAEWALDFSPLVSADHPDGLWIDATGTDHLYGGEEAMLGAITARLQKGKLSGQLAIADTPGAAWACAHYSNETIIKPGESKKSLIHLPVAALRIKNSAVEDLRRVGVRTIGELIKLPRRTVPHRFKKEVLRRLDQALGFAPEPINPVFPIECKSETMRFAEPMGTRAGLERCVTLLSERLCKRLELVMEGAKRLDLVFYRVDNTVQALRVASGQGSYDPKHISKMFIEKLETVDPGFGIETVILTANVTELIKREQIDVLSDPTTDSRDMAILTDRLINMHGASSVYKTTATESGVPERAVKRVGLDADSEGVWLKAEHRPIRLFTPPEPIEVTAMLPDHPPLLFRWRSKVHKISRAEALERIRDEWWVGANEIAQVRDYFKVEDDAGKRYWIYRDNRPTSKGMFNWFMHGIFA